MNWELPDEQAGFRKGRGTRDQTANIHWNSRKIPTSASLTMLKSLTVWIKANCGKFLKRWEYQITLPVPWENEGQKQQLELDMEQRTGSKLGKDYFKAVYCYPAYLTSIVHHAKCPAGRITSWNKDCQDKYQQPQISRWYHSNGRKKRGTKKPLDEAERRRWKIWLKSQYSKNKDHGIIPITSWQIDGGKSGSSDRLYFHGLQNHFVWCLQPWN